MDPDYRRRSSLKDLTLKTLITEEAEAEPGGVDAYCKRFDFPMKVCERVNIGA